MAAREKGEEKVKQIAKSSVPRGDGISQAFAPDEPPSERTQQGEPPRRPHRHKHWVWPLGLAVAGLGGAAAFILRGCWHTQMSWPTRHDDEFSYQVCTSCGIKRLYDEKRFHAYGPYGYDLHDLIAQERAARLRRLQKHEEAMRKNP